MSKRDTIIISVLVNAGLLVVLFITSVTSKEEVFVDSSAKFASTFMPNEKAVPIEEENFEIVKEELKEILPLQDLNKSQETKKAVVHRLPPQAKEAQTLPTLPHEENVIEHIVQRGDSLEKIAHLYHTSVKDLQSRNHLTDSFLKIGQRIELIAGEEKKEPTVQGEYYTVKVGDNPWTIAMKNHIKVDALLKMNHLNEEKARKLKPGDKLRIR